MKKETGNQLPCLKEDRWMQVCEAWYSVRPNVLEELINLIPSKKKYLIKAKVGAKNTDFIGSMHTGVLLCFHWNVFKYAVVFLLRI